MAKSSTAYICQNCGESYPKWQGQCPNCGEWNTLVETIVEKPSKTAGAHTGAPTGKSFSPENVVSFPQVKAAKGPKNRLTTGIGELDRVLGTSFDHSGLVPGSVILIGGEPGIGKSTLLTQVTLNVVARPATDAATTVLYIAGEENPSQIADRIKRLSEVGEGRVAPTAEQLDGLVFVTTTDVDEIISIIRDRQPQLIIVDSIQTLQTSDLTGAEGSVGQLRESTQRLTETVKRLHIPVFLVGHVTKEGAIAGPKVLEHIVDAVLELSGERTDQLRILRAIKNRFGATDEVGVFRVAEFGLEEVPNPSEILLEHTNEPVPGSATVCVMEGTRPLLVEVQALVLSSQLAMPRRVGRGIELSRIQVLAAVLQRHAYLPLGTSDIFVSAAGGFTVREPSVDLGVAVAMASSLSGRALPEKTVFIGEVGLLGEIRAVTHLERRIKEAKRLGFNTIISRQTHKRVSEVLREFKLTPSKKSTSSES